MDEPLTPPKRTGYRNRRSDLRRFYWRLQRNPNLTLTGSWLEDQRRFPDWWDDIELCETMHAIEKDDVRRTVAKLREDT